VLKWEVERAVTMFPEDECEAICELIRRSHSIPDLKRVLLVHGAYVSVAQALDIGRWVVRQDGVFTLPTTESRGEG
jgi:hypothetical protein